MRTLGAEPIDCCCSFYMSNMEKTTYSTSTRIKDPRLYENYGQLESRKCPTYAGFNLPLPAFGHITELERLETERRYLADENVKLAFRLNALAKRESNLQELVRHAYYTGFFTAKKLILCLKSLEQSQSEDKQMYEAKLTIIAKEKQARRMSAALLKPRKTRWELLPTQPSSFHESQAFEREIVFAAEDEEGKKAPLPTASEQEVSQLEFKTKKTVRVSQVNDNNRLKLPPKPSPVTQPQTKKNSRLAFKDITNKEALPSTTPFIQSSTKTAILIDSPPTDPERKRRKKTSNKKVIVSKKKKSTSTAPITFSNLSDSESSEESQKESVPKTFESIDVSSLHFDLQLSEDSDLGDEVLYF